MGAVDVLPDPISFAWASKVFADVSPPSGANVTEGGLAIYP